MELQFGSFVRKPFIVEAVEVTQDNIAEVAEMIGTLRKKENGVPYIAVNRRLVPNLYKVFIGFYVTRMGDNIRCYSKRVFKQQFMENDSEIANWIKFLEEPDLADDVAS